MEPLDKDKVVSPRKVVSLGETLQLRMMISSRLDAAPWGEENGGSLGSIGVTFLVRGGDGAQGVACFRRLDVVVSRRWEFQWEVQGKAKNKQMGLGLPTWELGCGVTGQVIKWV